MNWILGRKLKRIGDRANPERAFVKHLEVHLRQALGHRLRWIQGWKWAVSGLTVVSLVGSSTGVYAYTSDDVLPDHPLYVLRQGIEQMETAVAATPKKKVEVQVKHLKRRVHENDLMVTRKKQVSRERLNAVESDVQKTIDASTNLPDDAQEQIDETVDRIEEHHEKVLIKQRDNAETEDEKEQADDLLEKAKHVVDKKIESLQEKRKSHFTRVRQRQQERRAQQLLPHGD